MIINIDNAEHDGDLYVYPLIESDVEVVQYIGDCEWQDITKKKGKYIKGKFIIEQIKESYPDELELSIDNDYDFEYEFEIEHEGEFNPKLLQLKKSDYEFIYIPYGIFANLVVYDGKEVYSDDDIEESGWINFKTLKWDESNEMYM